MQNIKVNINPCSPPEWAFHPNNILVLLDLGKHKEILIPGIKVSPYFFVKSLASVFKNLQIAKGSPPLITILELILEERGVPVLEKPSQVLLFDHHGSMNL